MRNFRKGGAADGIGGSGSCARVKQRTGEANLCESRANPNQEKGREDVRSGPREKTRRRPTERYGIDVVMRVDEDEQTDAKVINKKQ